MFDDDDDDDDNNGHGDDDSQLVDGYFELDKPHVLSLLNHPDTPCHSVDHPVKSQDTDFSIIYNTSCWNFVRRTFSHSLMYFPVCASTKECIGEFFEPHSQKWNCLVSPPDLPLEHCHVSYPVITDETNDRLLVHFTWTDVLYAYYPANGNWVCLDRNFGPWGSATALVDGVLYFHRESPNFLAAYDVTTESWLKVVHSSPFSVAYSVSEFTDMLHLGDGILCLASSGFVPAYVTGLSTTRVQFAKFRVKRANLAEVHITHDGYNSFSFENRLLAYDFIAL